MAEIPHPAEGEEMSEFDKYPNDVELNKIRDWPCQDGQGLLEFIRDIWWAADWGFGDPKPVPADDIDAGMLEYRISTGGWSGNELIIETMMANDFWWMLHWTQSRRGGHHIFRVKSPSPPEEK